MSSKREQSEISRAAEILVAAVVAREQAETENNRAATALIVARENVAKAEATMKKYVSGNVPKKAIRVDDKVVLVVRVDERETKVSVEALE